MTPKRLYGAMCLFVLLAVAAGLVVFQHQASAAQGSKAPNFALKDLDGKVCKLSDYKGKVVAINFFAVW